MEALASSPETVRDVHDRYVAAGVDVLTTNTWGLPTAVADAERIADELHRPLHWMEVTRRVVAVAREPIARGGREGDCAVGFSINGDIHSRDGLETIELLTRALAPAPPDLILLETLSVVTPSLLGIVKALVATGLPVWLSFRRCRRGLCGVYRPALGWPGRRRLRSCRQTAGGDRGRCAAHQLHSARPRRRDGVLPARLH